MGLQLGGVVGGRKQTGKCVERVRNTAHYGGGKRVKRRDLSIRQIPIRDRLLEVDPVQIRRVGRHRRHIGHQGRTTRHYVGDAEVRTVSGNSRQGSEGRPAGRGGSRIFRIGDIHRIGRAIV